MIERLFAWGALGGLLFLFFGDRWYWYPIAATPWLIVGVCLLRMPTERFREALRRIEDFRSARMALLLHATLLIVAAWLFGHGAAVLAVALLGAVGLAALQLSGAERGFELLIGLAITGVTLLVMAVVGEALVSHPASASTWGSPRELASWRIRYDPLGRRGNILSFRTSHEQIAKTPGTLRIVALGDSYTWGDKIAGTENVWPALLESILAKEAGRLEVINLGMRGYSTRNEVELMSRLGWQFEPDLVLLQFLVNDVYPSGPDLRQPDHLREAGWVQLLPLRFRGGAAGGSALLAYLEKQVNDLRRDSSYRERYREGAEGWEQVRSALKVLGAEAAERGVPVVMVMTPRLARGLWTAETHPDRWIHLLVGRTAAQEGLQVLDLLHAFGRADRPGEEWRATPYDAHPGEEAHALIAREIARFLKEQRLLPAAGGS